MENKPWYSRAQEDVLDELMVEPEKGLSQEEAKRRLELVGYNQLTQQKPISPLIIFFQSI